ncbi:hypothetical protein VP01_3281g1 [Puccinia sorghi]|uniref:Uncharacterized protein n=1 Tax=Puccinia sorghi TaxID=27349 RepID=A0A0L6UXP9_9BASI|nr:hypothetical protein VP01_3281g1 [Puccinia sorghi]
MFNDYFHAVCCHGKTTDPSLLLCFPFVHLSFCPSKIENVEYLLIQWLLSHAWFSDFVRVCCYNVAKRKQGVGCGTGKTTQRTDMLITRANPPSSISVDHGVATKANDRDSIPPSLQKKLTQLPAVNMQHASAKLPSKLHLFAYVDFSVCTVTVHKPLVESLWEKETKANTRPEVKAMRAKMNCVITFLTWVQLAINSICDWTIAWTDFEIFRIFGELLIIFSSRAVITQVHIILTKKKLNCYVPHQAAWLGLSRVLNCPDALITLGVVKRRLMHVMTWLWMPFKFHWCMGALSPIWFIYSIVLYSTPTHYLWCPIQYHLRLSVMLVCGGVSELGGASFSLPLGHNSVVSSGWLSRSRALTVGHNNMIDN